MVSTLGAGSASTLAATRGSLAALIVTVVVLLALGAVLWSFLRRGGAADIAPLAVDQLEAPRVPEPTDPTLLGSGAAPTDAAAEELAHAVDDEISEGGPVDGSGGPA